MRFLFAFFCLPFLVFAPTYNLLAFEMDEDTKDHVPLGDTLRSKARATSASLIKHALETARPVLEAAASSNTHPCIIAARKLGLGHQDVSAFVDHCRKKAKLHVVFKVYDHQPECSTSPVDCMCNVNDPHITLSFEWKVEGETGTRS